MFTRKSNLSLGSCPASSQAVSVSDTVRTDLKTRLPEASWRTWTTPRKVPFFADTLHFTYPFPILALLLIISVGFSKTELESFGHCREVVEEMLTQY